MDGYPYVVNVVSLISGCDFAHVWNAVFQEAEDLIYLALSQHVYDAVDGFPYDVAGLFQKAMDVVFNVLSLHI